VSWGATDEVLPLISDIDFTIIEKGMNREDRGKVIDSYSTCISETLSLPGRIITHMR
jgi:hypothetical protein